MGSLFDAAKDPSVVVGDYYINVPLDEADEPHPMRRVRVQDIDDTGMITLVAGIAGLGGMKRVVSPSTLRDEYRKEE